jgi:uncharacterized protein with PhoU and TrkA domain
MPDTPPRIFSAQLHIKKGGFADGSTLSEVLAKADGQMRVDKIQRSESLFLAKLPQVKLQPGDRLFVKDSPENLKHYEKILGATLYNAEDEEHPVDDEFPLEAGGQQLAEVVVTRGSPLHLRTLAAARFTGSYGLMPLALHRARAPSSQVTGDLNTIRLRAGDVLLVQGSGDAITHLKDSGSMLVLDGTTSLPHTHRAKRALAVMAFVVAAAALGILPIAVSAVLGLGLMLATGCLTWRDAAGALSIPVIMIIVASLALGKALLGTGMADYLAMGFVGMTSAMPIPFCFQQRRRRDRNSHRHRHRAAARRAGRPVHPRDAVRCEHEFRDTLRLPDKPVDPERRRLQVHRLPASRYPTDDHHVGRVLPDPAGAVLAVKPRPDSLFLTQGDRPVILRAMNARLANVWWWQLS